MSHNFSLPKLDKFYFSLLLQDEGLAPLSAVWQTCVLNKVFFLAV